MSFTLSTVDHPPLFQEIELTIPDENVLAENIGFLLLGHQRHVQSILDSKNKAAPPSTDVMIDRAIGQLSNTKGEARYKRDGWIFQMMTWIALRKQHSGARFICQIPHDAPAQHGIDGLGVKLTAANRLEALIIAEDKYTEYPRKLLREEVWPEFESFENGTYDAQLVNRATGLLNNLSDAEIDALIANDIYTKDVRVYKAGITPESSHNTAKKKRKLFKDYDNCVKGKNHFRRIGVTFQQDNIRDWMDDFCDKITDFLEAQRP